MPPLLLQSLGIPVENVFANNILFDVSERRVGGAAVRGVGRPGLSGWLARSKQRLQGSVSPTLNVCWHAYLHARPHSYSPGNYVASCPLCAALWLPSAAAAPLAAACRSRLHEPSRLPLSLQHDGAYDGFDPAEFTSSSGGKREAVQHIKQVGGRAGTAWLAEIPNERQQRKRPWQRGGAGQQAHRPSFAPRQAAPGLPGAGCTSLATTSASAPHCTSQSLPFHPSASPPVSCSQAHGFSKVVMVGDGITDFEARAEGGADAFIGCVGDAGRCVGVLRAGPRGAQRGRCRANHTHPEPPSALCPPPCRLSRYGGVVYRENVAKLSDWYVFSIADITAALQQATTALSAR